MKIILQKQLARAIVLALFLLPVNTGYAQTNCGDPAFPAGAEILANVPEAAGYNLVYQLPIPAANQAWLTQADVPYSINNAAALGAVPFSRVAYYLKLESALLGPQWIWVSMDAFTNDLAQISIPTGATLFQQSVTNMNVMHYALPPRSGISGNLEFWSACYNTTNAGLVPGASDAAYDFGDEIIPGDNCYGSFQIHDPNAMESLISYNGWAFAGATAEDLGIGNYPGTNTDWTLADNAALYDVRELYVFVDAGPSYQLNCTPASISLDANGQASITASMVTDAVVGNCGVTDVSLSSSNFTCANLGANTVTVTVTRNGSPITCEAVVTVSDDINPTVNATGTTLALGCDPTAAAIDAALGSATASDNCGALTPDVTTDPVVVNGSNVSQTRHFTATDASNNSASTSRTVTWQVNCTVNVPHIFQKDVSCSDFLYDASPLAYACYTVKNNKVNKVSPKSFFYYATVTAPSVLGAGRSFYIDVVQTKSCPSFNYYEIKGNQVRASTLQCAKVSNGTEVSRGQGRVKVSNATPGAVYVVSVKYDTKSLEGSTFSGQPPVCAHSFVTKVTANGAFGTGVVQLQSNATLEARPNCEVPEPVNEVNKTPFAENADRLDNITASPNPSAHYFELNLDKSVEEQVNIRVFDANGKMVQSISGVTNTVVRIGEKWRAGVYFVELSNGKERKTLRLVKGL